MSLLLKQEIKYYIINTDVTNNLSLKKRIPCIQYVKKIKLRRGKLFLICIKYLLYVILYTQIWS